MQTPFPKLLLAWGHLGVPLTNCAQKLTISEPAVHSPVGHVPPRPLEAALGRGRDPTALRPSSYLQKGRGRRIVEPYQAIPRK